MKFHRLAVNALALLSLSASMSSNAYWGALAEDAAAADSSTTLDGIVAPDNAETFKFEAEVHRMLDIVVNSLYQNKDVFIRELISNASDALDKFKYLTLTEPEKYKTGDDVALEVKLEFDPEARTFVIRDTGVGMTHDEMVSNLGTVARSGTTKFMEALAEKGGDTDDMISQIGQFGVGFYSAFLVAEKVVVASKHPTSDKQYVWESENGASSFQIYEDPRGNTLDRGTEIILHLKEDALEYTEESRVEELAKHYSEFVMHPLYLKKDYEMEVEDEDAEDEDESSEDDDLEVGEDEDIEDEEKEKKMKTITSTKWEVLNENTALWRREKDDISDEEYQSFYTVLSGDDFNKAETWNHFNAEGNINFKSLIYLPDKLPDTYRSANIDGDVGGIRLYVRRVLISDNFDLMPRYLGFVWGVVDSDDLPLNVNRETLQESKIITVIRKKLVRKTLEMIRSLIKEDEKAAAEEDEDDDESEAEVDAEGNVKVSEKKKKEKKTPRYTGWYEKFSPSIKLGVIEDDANRSKLTKLLRFKSSKSGEDYVSFEQYIENKKDWQDEIYVLAGSDIETMEKSPFLDPFREKDVEVLYLTDPIDEYMFQHVKDFDNHKIIHVSSEGVKFKDEDEDLVKRREKAYKTQFKPLVKWLKKLYGNSISRVVISKRLGKSPAIVSSGEYGYTANMERIMKAQAMQHGQDPRQMGAMKIFEINPRHPLVHKLLDGCPPEKKDDDEEFTLSPEVIDAAWILHDMAMLNGGFQIHDTEAHSERMVAYVQKTLDVESLDLEPEIDPPIEEEDEDDDDSGPGPKVTKLGYGNMGDDGNINLMDEPEGMNLDDLDINIE